MSPHDIILLRLHRERMANHLFAMLMLKLGVSMRGTAPVEDCVRRAA